MPLALSVFSERGQYHVLTMSHSFLLFPIAGEFIFPVTILFPISLEEGGGVLKVIAASAWKLTQFYHTAFHLSLEFWGRPVFQCVIMALCFTA